MALAKLSSYSKNHKATTPLRDPKTPVIPDCVGSRFTAEVPNQVYVLDTPRIPFADGWNMCLAAVV